MQIIITDSYELAQHPYVEIEPGTYHAPGRVVIVQPDQSVLLILTGTTTEQ